MKTIIYTLSLFCLGFALTSCSHQVYNNKSFLAANSLEGKKLAVLPVEVYFTGNQPKNADLYAEEQSTSLSLQNEVEQAYLRHTSNHNPKKHQHKVQMVDVNTVNQRLRTRVADLRTTWGMSPDTLGQITGADLVLKVRVTKNRYMSQGTAKAINTGATILDVLMNSNSKNPNVTILPRVKAGDVSYEVSLIDVKTGTVVSSYTNNPEKDNNGNSIKKVNSKMAEQSAVFAAN